MTQYYRRPHLTTTGQSVVTVLLQACKCTQPIFDQGLVSSKRVCKTCGNAVLTDVEKANQQ
jgi:hypothetical protein